MIWGVYAMRVDIIEMKNLMNKPLVGMNMSSMDMSDPMSMSMRDMGMMLEGQTGDALDRSFLEGMIPHHQGAVDMAKYLVNAKHPELKKMGQEIIIAQEKEIAQMKQWMMDWGYTMNANSSSSMSPQEEMMRDHCKTMPSMAGCEKYR
ncbi:DUF305 domain-containing protein [Candidatus Gracilibacteria bacterium]|nr:DUF305 domain-containing protein [Candidatus Gracilibacteria bacterium]